jgi:CheY-like chemotaxis protein
LDARLTGREEMGNRPAEQRLLIVDDDAFVLQVFKEILDAKGFQVTSVLDGESALELIDEEEFDLVLTDLGVPLVDGWTIARRVKARSPLVPVVLLTGWCDPYEETGSFNPLVDLILTKPCSTEQVLSAIEMLLPACGAHKVEQRKFKRAPVREGTFIAFEDVDKSRPRLGELIDVSRGGLALRYISDGNPVRVSSRVELFKYDHPKIRIESCKVVYDRQVLSDACSSNGNDSIRRCGIEFVDPSRSQFATMVYLFKGLF